MSFPVRLFAAARAETVHFHMLHKKDLSRVKEVWYCVEENKPIERSEIVKGYETAKDDYVVVDDEELKKIAPATASTMEILQFVKSNDVDPILFESSYYVAPDEKGRQALCAVPRGVDGDESPMPSPRSRCTTANMWSSSGPPKAAWCCTRLYYAEELHKANKADAPKTKFSAKELELAKSLVGHMSAPFKPAAFHDSYRENVERLIEQKKKGQKITAVKQPRKAPVIDLMEALKAQPQICLGLAARVA